VKVQITKHSIAVAVIMLLFLGVNTYFLRDTPLPGDTSPYISNAFHTQKLDYVPTFPNRHPGLASSFWQEFMLIFGFDSILQFRLLYAVLFLMPMLAMYLFGSERDKAVGLVALMFFVLNPISIYNISSFENQAFSTVLLLVALYCFYYAWEHNRGFLPLAAFLAAAAAYNREDAFFLPLVMGAYILLTERNLRCLKLRVVIISGLVYVATLLPMVIIQYGLKGEGWGIFAVTKRLLTVSDTSPFYYVITLPDSITYLGLIFLVGGVYLVLKTRDKWRLFMFSWFLVYLGVLSAVPYKTLSYGAPFTPALLLIVADALVQTSKYAKKKVGSAWAAPAVILLVLGVYAFSTYNFFRYEENPTWYWPNAYATNSEMQEIAGSIGLCPHLVLLGAITEIEYFLPTQSVGFGWVSNSIENEIKSSKPQVVIIPDSMADNNSERIREYLRQYPLLKKTQRYSIYKLLPYDCKYKYDPYSKFVIGSMVMDNRTYPVVWQWPELLPWYSGRLTAHFVQVLAVENGKVVDITSAKPDGIEYSGREVTYIYGRTKLTLKSDDRTGEIIAYLAPASNVAAVRMAVGNQVAEHGSMISGENAEVGRVKPKWTG